MRYLLAKNYKGEKCTRKYLNKSPASMMSGLNKKHLKININNKCND